MGRQGLRVLRAMLALRVLPAHKGTLAQLDQPERRAMSAPQDLPAHRAFRATLVLLAPPGCKAK